MSFSGDWDWDKEVASWNKKRNTDIRNKRYLITDKGEIVLPHKHRHHECDDRDCHDIKACDRNIHRSFEVSLPITIIPYALPGEPDACCGSEARIRHGHRRSDHTSNRHEFTVSQIINVEIPIEFGAKICYEDYYSEERGRCTNDLP